MLKKPRPLPHDAARLHLSAPSILRRIPDAYASTNLARRYRQVPKADRYEQYLDAVIYSRKGRRLGEDEPLAGLTFAPTHYPLLSKGLLTPNRNFNMPEKRATGKYFLHIIGALVLQDMKTRFVGGFLSYGVAISWPLTHAIGLLSGYLIFNHMVPVGNNPGQFALSGVLPYILCFYPGRMMPLFFLNNRILLNIPNIKPIHLISASIVVECCTSLIVSSILIFGMALLDFDIFPDDYIGAAVGLAAAMLFSIGLGVLNVVLTAFFGTFYIVFYVILFSLLYLAAGVFSSVNYMSEKLIDILLYNPVFVLIFWIRSACYQSYDLGIYPKVYIIALALVFLLLGLAGERFGRNRFFS